MNFKIKKKTPNSSAVVNFTRITHGFIFNNLKITSSLIFTKLNLILNIFHFLKFFKIYGSSSLIQEFYHDKLYFNFTEKINIRSSS